VTEEAENGDIKLAFFSPRARKGFTVCPLYSDEDFTVCLQKNGEGFTVFSLKSDGLMAYCGDNDFTMRFVVEWRGFHGML
jgi:hypothetical protein